MIIFKYNKLKVQLKKLFQYGVGQFVNLIVPFIISPYLIITCGEANFGKSAIGLSIAFLIIVFVDYGSDIIGVKEISQNRNNLIALNKVFSKIIYGKIIFAFLFAILFYLSVILFVDDPNSMLLYQLSGTIFIVQIANPFWILQGLEDFKNYSVATIISKMSYLLFCFLLVKKENDFVYINLCYSLGVLLSGFYTYMILNKKYGIQFIKPQKNEIKSYFNTNKTFTFSQVFTWFQLYSPILIISFLGNDKLVGQFRIIDQIISVFKTYIMMSFNFIYPKICFEINITYVKAIKNWKRFNLANFIIVSTLLLIIFIFKKEIMTYYKVDEITKMTQILEIAIIYPILFLSVNIYKQLFLALNFEKLFSIITIIMAVFNAFAIVSTFLYFELFGVYYSCIFIETLTLLILIAFNYKYNIIKPKNCKS